jgi:hypothetical protein
MAKQRGLYEIHNTVTGDVYIGSSLNIPSRLNHHRLALVRGRHHSKRLQEDWDTYGPDAFTFQMMRALSEDDWLSAEEALAILELKPAYNTGKPMKIESREEYERRRGQVRLWREQDKAREQATLASRRPIKVDTRLDTELECDCGSVWRIISVNDEWIVERVEESET